MTKTTTFSKDSKVWIYQSATPFQDKDVLSIRQKVQKFARQWASHSQQLKARGDVYYNRFIVFIVDETQTPASGCSIDKSVNFIQSIEREFDVDMFNRMNFAYEKMAK